MPMTSLKGSRLISSQLEALKDSSNPGNWEIPIRSRDTLPPNASDSATYDVMSSSSTSPSPSAAATAAAVRAQSQPHSRDAQKSANSTQQATKNLDLDDNELKNLLDEAYSYKGPKDKENKSAIFKELLHKAELEDQQEDTFYSSRQFRGNNRRLHTGGSLQDLVDSVNKETLFDCDIYSSQTSRIHRNLRVTKQLTAQSTSVSSRQREGGSLPNNVNASILAGCYPVSSLSLSKYPKVAAKSSAKTKTEPIQHDYERNSTNYHRTPISGGSSSGGDDGSCVTFRTLDTTQSPIASTSATQANANDKNHTIINIGDPEESRHLLAHDSLAQDTSEAIRDDGTELVSIKKQRVPTMSNSYLTTNLKDSADTSRPTCHVDQSISFLRYSTAETAQFPTNVYRKTPVDPKYPNNRHVHLNSIPTNQNKLDENGNAIPPKPTTISLTSNHNKPPKKRSNKADRNTTTWTVPQGSEYNIDTIVAFIENTESTRKANIINVNKNNLSATERTRKEKKNSGNSKKEVNRLKKSTSMEELKSSSKIEEEANAQSERAQVSMRHKQNQQNAQKRSTTAEGKDSSAKQSANKRGDRRSWGTEELNDLESVEDRETRKQKENKPNQKNNNNNKKTEQLASSNASIESIPTTIEAADFQVVAKKKKTKKRQILEEAKAKQQMNQRDQTHGRNAISNSTTNNGNKYQPSSSYTNDREIYVNSLIAKENRRKSTSSVPPSDKSDSSDLDSVHSLPIESTTPCPSMISYAEIARKANQPEKLANVNAWPPVSQNGKSSESPENSNVSTSSSTVSSRSHVSNRSQDTIKAVSPSEEKTQPILDDAKTVETPKLPPTSGDIVKNQLQKSKSCDNEKYTATVNLDQFPGLEKTVKPQKIQPNFASVLTSPPPLMPSTNDKSSKGPVQKKSPQSAEKTVATVENHSSVEKCAIKAQKSVDEQPKQEIKPAADINSAKLVFVQNSAKAEEIVNSDSSNVFVPINNPTIVKKPKKSHANAIPNQANIPSRNNNSQRTVRQTAVIFSDHDINHENVSPLQFGDFNDDILQLMKEEENRIDDDIPNGQPSIDSVAGNCTNTFENVNYQTVNNEYNQLKSNIQTPMMSSKSDPAYASAHRTTIPTESHEVVDIHKVHTENHVGNSTNTELSSKKSNVTKRTSFNKINVNNKTSDVVSNQSLNNNNMINNNISVGETTVQTVGVSQSISDSDSLNNNINMQMNDKNRHHKVDADVIKSQSMHSDAGITKSSNASQNVNNTVSKASNQSAAAYHQQKGIMNHDSVNNKTLDNINNVPKMAPSSNKRPATENEVVLVNSHPANVPHENASYAETRVPFVGHNHNHNDIVHFVGSAWEEVKFGGAHYFGGQ